MKVNQEKARQTMEEELKRQFDELAEKGWCTEKDMEEAKNELKGMSYIDLVMTYAAFKD